MPGQIVALARRYMSAPTHIRAVDPNSDSSLVDAIEQHVWRAHQMDKPELIARVLQAEGILDRWDRGPDGFRLTNSACPYRRAALATDQMKALTSLQISNFGTDQIRKIETEDIAMLTSSALRGLTTELVKSLGTDQLNALQAGYVDGQSKVNALQIFSKRWILMMPLTCFVKSAKNAHKS